MQRLHILLGERDKTAPDRIFRRNRIGLQPAADGELVEVVARFAGAVEIGDVKPVHRGIVRSH